MLVDWGLLTINRVILHGVPSRRTGGARAPDLSEAESVVPVEALNYLRRKLIGSLAGKSYPIVFDYSQNSPLPGLVVKSLSGANQDFIQDSQAIANHLFQMQPGISPPGMLAVVECRLGAQRAFAVVKLEHDEGTRATPDDNQRLRAFRMEHLQDLMMTGKGKIFKVGMFVREGADPNGVIGRVVDSQVSRTSELGVADYFLRKFLGCDLEQDPAGITQDFYTATERWINTADLDPDRRARYAIAVMAEMKRNTDTIDPHLFASQHLDRRDRAIFIDHLGSQNVPTIEFPKNTERIANRLSRVSMSFESGLLLFGDPKVFDDKVQIRNLGDDGGDGLAEITITDRVKRMQGRASS